MEIKKEMHDNITSLELIGRLDTMTAPQLQDALTPEFSESGKNVSLDFSRLEYVSSAGLRVLLTAQKNAQKAQGKLTLTHVSADIMEVFQMTGFTNVLNIE